MRELGMVSMTDNASMNVAMPNGTLMGGGPNTLDDKNGGMEDAVNTSNDTTMMDVPGGTVPDVDNRWGTF